MRYAVVIESAGSNYSAYVPDLPGCVATGSTLEEAEAQIREAISFHLDGLRADNLPIPPASSRDELRSRLQPNNALHPSLDSARLALPLQAGCVNQVRVSLDVRPLPHICDIRRPEYTQERTFR